MQVHVLAPHGPVLVCGPCGPDDREVPRSGSPDGVLRQGERTLSLMQRVCQQVLPYEREFGLEDESESVCHAAHALIGSGLQRQAVICVFVPRS